MLVNLFKLTGHTNIDHPFTYLMSVSKIACEQNYRSFFSKILRKTKKSSKVRQDSEGLISISAYFLSASTKNLGKN